MLKVDTKLRSPGSSCQVIVVKGSDRDAVLLCAGSEMSSSATRGAANGDPRIEVGKRYSDDDSGIEVLCTSAGKGSLTFEGRELIQRAAKPLPASD